jgi:predicted alpha/beta hydrolase
MTRVTRTLALLPLLAGCYVYRPVGAADPVGRDRVRLTLTDSGAVNLASQLGPATEEVSGRVVSDSAGAYLVSVLGTRRRGGTETDWRGERVAIPRLLVSHAEERRFSRRRTVLASIAVMAAAIGAREAFWGPGGVFAGSGSGGGPSPR